LPSTDPNILDGNVPMTANRFADASLWLVFASLIATFDIRPLMKDGKPVLPSVMYTDGAIPYVDPTAYAVYLGTSCSPSFSCLFLPLRLLSFRIICFIVFASPSEYH
jgi:hypothetical protein